MSEKRTPQIIRELKGKRKIIALTAYDYSFANLIDQTDVDIILVGDSLGMVVLGDTTTKNVTMDDICRATEAVRRGVRQALVVSDMPYKSFDTPELAIQNAKRLITAGAEAVKIEGYGESLQVAKALIEEGIAVMGHLGLTPQVAKEFKVQGKENEEGEKILKEANAFDACGVFSLVLECIPRNLATTITQKISTPTIGIGAGNNTDGQILVSHDILGLYPNLRPKFVRQFANVTPMIQDAVAKYKEAVTSGDFPNEKESFGG